MGFGPCGLWTPNLGGSAPTQGRKVGAVPNRHAVTYKCNL